MSNLALVCIATGILAVVFRSPMIFAPETSMEILKKVIADNKKMRALGIFFSHLWMAMIFFAWNSDHPAASIIMVLGCIFAVITAFFLLIFPSLYRAISVRFIDMNPKIVRGIGVIGVIIGIVFIYLGIAVF